MIDIQGDKIEQDNMSNLLREINYMSKWTLKGQRYWSVLNNLSIITIVAFSSVAAVLTQIENTMPFGWKGSAIATILSLIVAIVTTIQSKIGFERKWEANRRSQSALRQLLVDIECGDNMRTVGDKLKAIIASHDSTIIGDKSS